MEFSAAPFVSFVIGSTAAGVALLLALIAVDHRAGPRAEPLRVSLSPRRPRIVRMRNPRGAEAGKRLPRAA
ncbi:MAG: hypothetical protein PHP86_18965 [Nevskiales bacterium]|nr:hypothetical protein [Nevskiales bacterium]